MGLFDFFKKKDKNKDIVPTSTEEKSGKFYDLEVADVIKETSKSVSIYFNIPGNLKSVFEYRSGQYITIRINKSGKPILRSYSISSCPDSDDFFRIAIKEKPGGELSGELVNNTKKGDKLSVFPPLGHFVIDDSKPLSKNYFLFAGGSGITPLISIAKNLLKGNSGTKVVLVYANKNNDSIIYQEEIEQLKQYHSELFVVTHILDETDSENSTAKKGIYKARDYADLLNTKYKTNLDDAKFYVCGPTAMMQEVEQGLKDFAGVDSKDIHIEYFDMDKQSHSNSKEHIQSSSGNSGTSTKEGDTLASIKISGKTHQITIPEGSTVLDIALNNGIDAPFMCEAGVCSSCRALLKEGQVKMLECHALSDAEIKEGYILTCQSIPQTDKIVVDYDA